MKKTAIQTPSAEALIDITGRIEEEITRSGVSSGLCLIYVPHTTAGLTINENADPAVRRDILMTLGRVVPDGLPYEHGEGNSPAHVKASLMGSSVCIPIENGRLALGTWQGVFFCEFDGPRRRRFYIRLIPA
jgi:secondary thiamine-phosphate synthase enzyme